jgi:hypothetical protein
VIGNLLTTALAIFAGLLAVRFWPRISAAFARFDARLRDRHAQEIADRGDATAHFRHTLSLAEEQVETVTSITLPDERTGEPVTRWLFEGERYAARADAERARADRMRAIARGFYTDLPAALRARKEDDRLGR